MLNRASLPSEQKLLSSTLTQDFIKKGNDCLEVQDFKTAIKCFEKATTSENESLKYKALAYQELAKGRQFFYASNYLLAAKAYDTSIKLLEKNFPEEKEAIAKLHAYKGQAFYAQSEHANLSDNSQYSENWDNCYKIACEYDSNAFLLRGELTYVVNYVYHQLLRMKQPPKDKHFEEIENPSVLFSHAQCMWKGTTSKGRYDEQIKHYLAAIKFYPDNPGAWLECGLARLNKSEKLIGIEWKTCLETAISDFNHIDQYASKSITSHYRGIAYAKLNDYVSAYSNFMRGIILDLKMTNNEIDCRPASLPEVRTAILEHLALSQKELVDSHLIMHSLGNNVTDQKNIPLYEKLTISGIKIMSQPTNSELYFTKADIWEKLGKLDLASYDYAVGVWLLENCFDATPNVFQKIFYYYSLYAISLLNCMESSYKQQDFQKGFDEFLFFMNTIEKFNFKKHFTQELVSEKKNPLEIQLDKLENIFTKHYSKDLNLKKIEFKEISPLKSAMRELLTAMGKAPDVILGQFVRTKHYQLITLCKNYCKEILISEGDAIADKNSAQALKFYENATKILSVQDEKRISTRIQIICPPVNILELFQNLKTVLEAGDLNVFENHMEKFVKELKKFLELANSNDLPVELPVQPKTKEHKDEDKSQKQTLVIMRSFKGYHGRSGLHIFKNKTRININNKINNIKNLLHTKNLDKAEKELYEVLEKFKDKSVQIQQKDFGAVIDVYLRYMLGILHKKASDIVDENEQKGAVYFEFFYNLLQTKPYFESLKRLLDNANYSLESVNKRIADEAKRQLNELKAVGTKNPVVKAKDSVENTEPASLVKEKNLDTPVLSQQNSKNQTQEIKDIPKIKAIPESKPSPEMKAAEVKTSKSKTKKKTKTDSSDTPPVPQRSTEAQKNGSQEAKAEQKTTEKEQKEIPCIIPNLKINLPDEAIQALKSILAAGGNRAFAVGGIVCEEIKPFNKKTDIDIGFGAAKPLAVLQKAFPGADIKPEGDFYKIKRKGQQTLEIWHSEALSDTTLSDIKALEKDAQNRDFTINALYANHERDVFDPTRRGYKDLNRELPNKPRLKCIIQAKKSFADDPIRILRAVYFSIKREIPLSYYMVEQIKAVDPGLFIDYMKANPIKTNCWMKKLLCLGDAVKNFKLLMELELLPKLFQGFGVVLMMLTESSTFLTDNLQKADDLLKKEKYPNLNVMYALWIQLLSHALLKNPNKIIDKCLIFKTNFPNDTYEKQNSTKQYLKDASMVLSAETRRRIGLQQQSLFAAPKAEAKQGGTQQAQNQYKS